jgi:hypothetical protein
VSVNDGCRERLDTEADERIEDRPDEVHIHHPRHRLHGIYRTVDALPGTASHTGSMRKWKLALAASVVLVATAASPGHALADTRHLVWGSCPDGGGVIGMECTTIQVPVNWAKPTGRKITLMLGRLRADGPKPATGTVLANFGAGAQGQ